MGGTSLKARALRALAQREHSRAELSRKLARHAQRAGARDHEAPDLEMQDLETQGLETQGLETQGDPAPHDLSKKRRAAPKSSCAPSGGRDRHRPALGGSEGARGPDGEPAPSPADIEALLDELTAKGFLSDARAAESWVAARAARSGTRQLRQGLQARGLAVEEVERVLAPLHGNEFDRAWALWQRKFGTPPEDESQRARQARFLMARGFDGDTVRRVLRAAREGPS